jgi:BolA protein
MTIADKIEIRLKERFSPTRLVITDDSHKHIGHKGAVSGSGHYAVEICAAVFAGKNRLESHRLIYQALEDFMKKDIHALQIKIV